jgi:hypothetical protein
MIPTPALATIRFLVPGAGPTHAPPSKSAAPRPRVARSSPRGTTPSSSTSATTATTARISQDQSNPSKAPGIGVLVNHLWELLGPDSSDFTFGFEGDLQAAGRVPVSGPTQTPVGE